MKFRGLIILIAMVSVLPGCVGTPKVSKWVSPPERHLTVANVFDAAVVAGTENKFTVMNSDRQSGIISLKQDVYGGDNKNNERRMSVRMKKVDKNSVEVRTKVSGSDFGIVEALLGGMVHKEITNNFYVYLFRELNISDASQRQVMIVDENSPEYDNPVPSAGKKEVSHVTSRASSSHGTAEAKPLPEPVAKPSEQVTEKKSEPAAAPNSRASAGAMVIVQESKVKLRQKPSAKSVVVKTLIKGENVQVLKEKDDWCLVELSGGETGWCPKLSLSRKRVN